MTMRMSVAADDAAGVRRMRGGIFGRQLAHYPANGPRAVYLGIVVLATIILYYELYVGGSVTPQIAAQLHMSLTFLISISIVGNFVGALGSLAAGLADQWGRANLVVYGLLLTGLLILFGIPNVHSRTAFLVLTSLVGIVEGMVLVATPALIRDFSPQLGRASAMGFWTMGPVIGSLVVSEVATNTLGSHADWQFQFRVCGVVGLVVFAVAFVGLRELSPPLRDQLMVSLRDQALVEARARNLDPEAALTGHWRQMLRLDIIGPAFAIAVFLLFYYMAVGLFVVYFATTFGYSGVRANALANWYWIGNAIALVVTGALSDALRVRKPFMVVGAVISAVGVALFALAGTRPSTSYHHFAVILLLIAVGGGMAFAAWMAAFTETVEKHNPAGTATGLAVWGSLLRVVVSVSLLVLIFVIPAASTLVDKGTRVQTLANRYAPQIATLQKLTPTTQTALSRNPKDTTAQAAAVSELSGVRQADVVKTVVLSTRYANQIATAGAVDPITLATLASTPTDTAAVSKAAGEIATRFHVDQAAAVRRLLVLSTVPKADLAFLQTTGPKVQTAADRLTAAGKVPAADLAYLQANAPDVLAAQKASPKQWQRWWWVCFGGQIVFLAFIGLLVGRWSPAKARQDAAAHEAALERELAALNNQPVSQT